MKSGQAVPIVNLTEPEQEKKMKAGFKLDTWGPMHLLYLWTNAFTIPIFVNSGVGWFE